MKQNRDGKLLRSAIGIGSNSIRLLVAQVEGGSVNPIIRMERVTRLAAYGVSPGGALTLGPRSIEATLDAARRFADTAREMGAPLKGALATEAARVADNSPDLMDKLRHELGAPVTIISGEEEAALGWRAIAHDYAETEGALGVIDVGGGSVTLSVGSAREDAPQAVLSIALGARELTRRYGLHKPVEYSKSLGNLASLSIEIHAPVAAMRPRPQSCVALGGTASVFASVYAYLERETLPGGTPLNRDWLASVFMRVAALPQERRVEMGVPSDVSDIAPAGAAILLVLLDTWGLRQFSLSERNILDGFLAWEVGRG